MPLLRWALLMPRGWGRQVELCGCCRGDRRAWPTGRFYGSIRQNTQDPPDSVDGGSWQPGVSLSSGEEVAGGARSTGRQALARTGPQFWMKSEP